MRLSGSFQSTVRRQLDQALLGEQAVMSNLKKRLGARLDELDTREDRLLDLGDPDWPRAKLKKKLADIERERTEIQGQLTDTASKLDQDREFFAAALTLLSNPQGFYRRGSDAVKRAVVKVIFSKLHVDAENIAGHDLTDGIAGLVEAGASLYAKSGPLPKEEAALDLATDADLLGVVLADHGPSRAAVVEVPGIEPGSSAASSRLLRAQSATSLLGPGDHADKSP